MTYCTPALVDGVGFWYESNSVLTMCSHQLRTSDEAITPIPRVCPEERTERRNGNPVEQYMFVRNQCSKSWDQKVISHRPVVPSYICRFPLRRFDLACKCRLIYRS